MSTKKASKSLDPSKPLKKKEHEEFCQHYLDNTLGTSYQIVMHPKAYEEGVQPSRSDRTLGSRWLNREDVSARFNYLLEEKLKRKANQSERALESLLRLSELAEEEGNFKVAAEILKTYGEFRSKLDIITDPNRNTTEITLSVTKQEIQDAAVNLKKLI